MNNLSWFIYLTQIVDNLQTGAGVLLIVGIMLAFIALVFGPMVLDMMDNAPTGATIKSWARTFAVVMGIAFFTSIVIPSRQTMILIAGSELGERAIKSDDVKSVVNPGMDL